MSRRGDCWDNAVAESFFATLKVEHAHETAWKTRPAARAAIFAYIEGFYKGGKPPAPAAPATSQSTRAWLPRRRILALEE